MKLKNELLCRNQKVGSHQPKICQTLQTILAKPALSQLFQAWHTNCIKQRITNAGENHEKTRQDRHVHSPFRRGW
jgi:hypothetical protein